MTRISSEVRLKRRELFFERVRPQAIKKIQELIEKKNNEIQKKIYTQSDKLSEG